MNIPTNSDNKPSEIVNTWSSMPPRMKRSAKGLFTLPDLARQELLPDPKLSIKALTDFLLPSQQPKPTKEPASLSRFFSKNAPSTLSGSLMTRLRHLPTPDATTVRQLVEFSRQAWVEGFLSVRYIHLEAGSGSGTVTFFPLWVITLWNEVLDVKKIRARWITSRDWIKVQLKQKKSIERRELAEQASNMLTILPWGMDRTDGVSNAADPIHTLWRYLGPNWLSDSEQDEMLELIRERCLDSPEKCTEFRVENIHFAAKLLEAFDSGSDVYRDKSSWAWLRHLGEDLAQGRSTVITVVHLGALNDTPHWVPLIIKKTKICFGDSFGTGMPGRLQAACLWWLRQHHVGLAEIVEPSIQSLPITKQIDQHSCGILADNALDHYVHGSGSPLLGNTNLDIITQRLRRFNLVSQHIIARLEAKQISIDERELQETTAAQGETGDSTIPIAALSQALFTFQFPLLSVPSAPTSPDLSPDLKRNKSHVNAPTPPSSPIKKRARVDVDPSVRISPLAFAAADLFAADASAPPANNHSDPLASTSFSPPTTYGWGPFDDDENSSEGAAPATELGPPAVPMRNSKITSFWKIASPEEKEELNQREFQKLKDCHEKATANDAEEKRRKIARGRTRARERQQAHRDRSKERKMDAGWVPGVKRKRSTNLEEFDTTQSASPDAEDSRPRRQCKEDQRHKNKPVGRKRKNEQTEAKYVNWFSPFLWSQIEDAAIRAGKPWSPRIILKEAQRHNPKSFSRLTEQVVGRWIDPEAKKQGVSCWKESVLNRIKKGNAPGGETTRAGILSPYPEVQDSIKAQLSSLREIGVTLSLLTIRAIMVATIQVKAPELFTKLQSDGTRFKCSDAFVQKFLHKSMGWSERRATKAAQKVPANHEEILTAAFLREAYVVRDHAVPADLRVNTDQTQMVYQQGTQRTWNESGAKQVSTVGQEEKRAFTLVPSISASGVVLPMQAIFMGKTQQSCPSPKAAAYAEAQKLGFRLLPSKTSTYWSTQETMQELVTTIIAPYFDKTKVDLNLPSEQCSIWKIDCWSVHKSEEFLSWMKTNHENIVVIFVPGGCTGLWQPLDVGIQRIMKLSIKRSAHRDVVDEVSAQIALGTKDIKLDVTLGTLRDRAVGWIVNAIHDISNKALVCKAFELCRVGPFNLSHASITSPEALSALRNLHKTNPDLFKELSRNSVTNDVDITADEPAFSDVIDDGSDIPIDVVKSHITTGSVDDGFLIADDGSLLRVSAAEDLEFDQDEDDFKNSKAVPIVEPVLGKGRRTKTARKLYGGDDAWSKD